jgi:IS30 family transposase
MPGARLTLAERLTLQRCFQVGMSQRQIAAVIGRSAATVSRELRRHPASVGAVSPQRFTARGRGQGYRLCYDAQIAHRRAVRRGRRPKALRLDSSRLRKKVWELLRADWSPQQIAQTLPRLFPDDPDLRVSHETIYQCLFVQTKGALKRELTAHLRSRRANRRARRGSDRHRYGIQVSDDIRISARPAEADDRAVPGHWEGDLVLGAVGKGAVLTLVERSSRFLMLAPLPGPHRADLTRMTLTEMTEGLPLQLRRSIAWDRGSEMAQHAQFTVKTGVAIYFCDPYSPWQRGTNENTNGLLRQYWPKGSDLSRLTMAECDDIALRLNTRPRKTLQWQTPAQAFNAALVATAD